MTDEAWKLGMRSLVLVFPQTGDEEETASRSDEYRASLDDLTDEQWLHAVETAKREWKPGDGRPWFPPIGHLRAWAERYVAAVAGYANIRARLPAEARAALEAVSTEPATEAERRAAIERGAKLLKSAVKALLPSGCTRT